MARSSAHQPGGVSVPPAGPASNARVNGTVVLANLVPDTDQGAIHGLVVQWVVQWVVQSPVQTVWDCTVWVLHAIGGVTCEEHTVVPVRPSSLSATAAKSIRREVRRYAMRLRRSMPTPHAAGGRYGPWLEEIWF